MFDSMFGWGCTDFNGYTAYYLIEQLLEKQMLLRCFQNRRRLAVLTCGFLIASLGVLRDSAAQTNGDMSAGEGVDTMIVDPAPTPYAITDYQYRSTNPSISVRDLLRPEKNQSAPGEIAGGELEIRTEPRPVRTLTDPSKIKWSIIGSEPVSPDAVTPSDEGSEQVEQFPNSGLLLEPNSNSGMLELLPIAEDPSFDNFELKPPYTDGSDAFVPETFIRCVYSRCVCQFRQRSQPALRFVCLQPTVTAKNAMVVGFWKSQLCN